MSIKMRVNKDPNSICCECGESQKDVLDMFDLCISDNIFTLCDRCNEKVLLKCLRAECMKNSRIKNQRDLSIIRRRGKSDYEARKIERRMRLDEK